MLILGLLLPMFCFAQKVIKQTNKNNILDLETEVEHYLKIGIETAGLKLNVFAGVPDGGIYSFLDENTDKKKVFKTDTELFNYLYKNGWKFVAYSPTAGRPGTTIIWSLFEKREE